MSTEKRSFVKMIQEHSGLLRSLSIAYYRNTADQEDAQQDIILELWKSFPKFRKECRPQTWIYKIAIRTLLRKKKTDRRQVTRASQNDLPEVTSPMTADDDQHRLYQLFDLLSARERGILILYLEGYNHKEIGMIMHLSYSNVTTIFARIKIKLKHLVKTISL